MSKFPGLINPFGGGTGGGGGGGTNSSGFVSGAAIQTVDPFLLTAEPISGLKAVALTNSGTVWTAMAGTSGRFPAIGITLTSYTSGQLTLIYRTGPVFNSGFAFSGWTTDPVYLGLSGDLVSSGTPQASGNFLQNLGYVISNSGMEIQLGDGFESFTAGSGDIGSGTITGSATGSGTTFFDIASGTIGNYDLGSGAIVRAAQFVTPFQSGTNWTLLSQEIISGVRAVNITQSGTVQVAMCSVSGRMPAHGICVDNVLSGIPVNIYTWGAFQTTSGLADYSGYLGKTIYCGRSGSLVTSSGSFNSGGLSLVSGGDFVQRLGTAYSSGAFLLSLDPTVLQNQLLGVLDLIDSTNRGFNF